MSIDPSAPDAVAATIDRVLHEDFEIPEEQLLPDAALFTGLGLDSLDIVDLIVALEKAFGVKLRPRDMQGFRDIRTLGDLHALIARLRQDAAAPPPDAPHEP
jgi:acyl carrier protein